MEDKLIAFIDLLRQNGVRASMAENLDALRAVGAVGFGEREVLRDTLRATLVKRGIDVPVFDELFELYFGGLGKTLRGVESGSQQAMQLEDSDYQQLLDRLSELLEDLGIELSPLAERLLKSDSGQLERMLRQAATEVQLEKIQRSFQEGRYSHSIAQQIGLTPLAAELDKLKEDLGQTDIDAELHARLRELIERRLRDLTELIKRMVRLELEKNDPNARENQRLRSLGEKNFYYLSEDEIRRMKEAVTKLAQRLKNVVAIRRRRGKRGKFDVKDTFRKNLQYGGVPFRIQFDRRIKDKPQVMVLCDVSDSVRNVSRFMLQFVYSLQDLYSRVRSFIFVSDLGEVTRLFDESEISDAIDEAMSGDIINIFAHSDFGRAFKTFHRDFLPAVNQR
ncbi:MAG TPA: VWA domain-containing protein, partial [Terriglobales bacterium]|nr:VWA domain-containing protein [Terriglobales bacterium]